MLCIKHIGLCVVLSIGDIYMCVFFTDVMAVVIKLFNLITMNSRSLVWKILQSAQDFSSARLSAYSRYDANPAMF
jgi:hypothetical protein